LYALRELFIHVLQESSAERRLLNMAKSRINPPLLFLCSDPLPLASGTAAAAGAAREY
jgi:hypothetical protein